MDKKLLLVGGGYADIPLIKAAQKLGFYVITTGNRPEELGHLASNEYHPADFSDPEAILALAKRFKIDAICPAANDFSAISSAYVAEQLGLAGHDAYETCVRLHHKDSYRQLAVACSIPTPKAQGFDSIQAALAGLADFQFPVLIKPVDLTGGKGISKLEYINQASQALEFAFNSSKAKRIVIEEFIEGSRHGFSSFIQNGKVAFYFADNEHYYLNPYLVSAASTPATVSTTVVQSLIQQSEKIAKVLNLKSGIFHVQYIVRDSQAVIIEICRRPPGDLYIKLVEYATGIDYSKWIIQAFTGSTLSITQQPIRGFHTRHCIMADKNGILDNITIDESIKSNIIERFEWWEKDQIITDYHKQKFGIIFLQFDSIHEMLSITENLPSLIKANIQSI